MLYLDCFEFASFGVLGEVEGVWRGEEELRFEWTWRSLLEGSAVFLLRVARLGLN